MYKKTICFDMDGTLADLYSVEDWHSKLRSEDVSPYLEARPMVKLNALAKRLNNLQKEGYKLVIISWTSKESSEKYHEEVAEAKKQWLDKHLKSVNWDEMHFIKYDTPKSSVASGILFDDNEVVRKNWNKAKPTNWAFDVHNILSVLEAIRY